MTQTVRHGAVWISKFFIIPCGCVASALLIYSASGQQEIPDAVTGREAQLFEVNGNQVKDRQDAIRYAHAIADESGHSVMVWEQETSLPSAWITPTILIGRANRPESERK